MIIRFFNWFTSREPYFYGLTYLFLIPIFALLFYFLPNLEIKYAESSPKFIQSIYFSIVTITTLGYGDITPQNANAQLLAASEALLGVIFIGLFLNSLSNTLSLSSQKAEKEREEKERYKDEVLKLQGYNRLVQLNIKYYLIYTIPVTSPILNRKSEEVNKDFLFNDMQDLFKPTLRLTDNPNKPAIAYYFESQVELQSSIKELICNVNVRYWSDLEEICMAFLSDCKTLDFSEAILNQPNTNIGDKKCSEYAEKLIKDHKGDIEFRNSNIMNSYFALFHLIKRNLEFIERYQSTINSIVRNSKS
jgi:hypothetical protein